LGTEIDLLKNYPKTKRDLDARVNLKSPIDQVIARKFDVDFFDGDRKHGYGGYYYNSRFWSSGVADFAKYWNLNSSNSVLDVGCGKGFMLYDFKNLIPELKVRGIDISNYAIENSMPEVREYLVVGDAKNLPFASKSCDYVISINTVHNLPIEECVAAIKEIERVSRIGSFIVVDAFDSQEEQVRMQSWNLTAQTILSRKDWVTLFEYAEYTGDYFWFTP
jgi:SAM-dependent methyltransferase